MRKIMSLVLLLMTAFFMTGCGSKGEIDPDDLPSLELLGNVVMEIEQYSEFNDPGASILGDFNLDVVVDSNVDVNTLGEYTITYTITYDSIDYVVSRTVRVVEKLTGDLPGLQFVGDATMQIEQYSDFSDPGVEIIGDYGLDIDVVSDVDVNTIGSYTITYTITYMEVDYNLIRHIEVVQAQTGPTIELTDTDCYYNDTYYSCDFSYDNSDFSNIHMWAELYKDGEYIETDILYEDDDFGFYYLDPETDYVIKLYASFTTIADGEEHYKSEISIYEFTTEATPLAPVVDNFTVTSTSNSVTIEFDLTDVGDNMKNAYIYLVEGWTNKASAEIFEGHNSITFDQYIYENEFYEIEINANYLDNGTFPTIYEDGVYTPPVISVDAFVETRMFYNNENVIMKLELDNYKEVNIDGVRINGVRYDNFMFPSDIDTLYIDMGQYSEAGTYNMNLSEIIITLGDEEYILEVKVTSEVPVYLEGSIVPSDASVNVIDIVPDDYYVDINFSTPSEISSLGVSVFLDNPYQLPVTSIKVGGVTYSGEDLFVVNYNQVRFTAKFSYEDSPSSSSLYFSSISFIRNDELIKSSVTNNGNVGISIIRVFDTDPTDDYPIEVLISTPQDLLGMEYSSESPNTIFRLTNDIDMSGIAFTPLGSANDSFGGIFDGNGHTISNITINRDLGADSDDNYIGLFGYALVSVTNLTLDNVNINVRTTSDNTIYVGALAGKLTGEVLNVHVVNSTITIDGMIEGDIGGMFGKQHGLIVGSSADTDITILSTSSEESNSILSVGGLVGIKEYDDIRNSYASGDISVIFVNPCEIHAGGLVGLIHNNGSNANSQYVKNSYATGDLMITGNYYTRTGGLIGFSGEETVILNSYASGDVNTSAGTNGGLIGSSYSNVISSFATGTVSGENGYLGRIFGDANNYKLTKIYAYDEQLVTRDGITSIIGNDIYYTNIGVAGWEQFNSPAYYTDYLGWSDHFFSFANLVVSNKVLPVLK